MDDNKSDRIEETLSLRINILLKEKETLKVQLDHAIERVQNHESYKASMEEKL